MARPRNRLWFDRRCARPRSCAGPPRPITTAGTIGLTDTTAEVRTPTTGGRRITGRDIIAPTTAPTATGKRRARSSGPFYFRGFLYGWSRAFFPASQLSTQMWDIQRRCVRITARIGVGPAQGLRPRDASRARIRPVREFDRRSKPRPLWDRV